MRGTKTPNWADSPHDVREYIQEAHAISTNNTDLTGTGEGIHIGIIDSACSLPTYLADDYDVNQGSNHSFISTDEDDTTRHGTAVFRRAAAYAPDAEYSLYQTVRDDRRMPIDAFSDAITRCIEDGVDLVNISIGEPWRHPADAHPTVLETKRLLEEGIAVVAAAGNHFPARQQQRPPVHCPSAAQGVISVGAMVTECPHAPGQESATSREGPYYWLAADHGFNGELAPSNGVFCGEQGCVGGMCCEGNKKSSPWDRNPVSTEDKPDILAPMHTIRRRETETHGWEYIATGTSFSAPLVTGSIGAIFSELEAADEPIPDPYSLQSAARKSGASIEDAKTPLYDAAQLKTTLRE